MILCAGSSVGCSSAPEEAAYLVNALVTDVELVAGDYEVPEEMRCGDRKYTFNGGVVEASFGTPGADVDLAVNISIDARGPDIFSISYDGGEEDPSFVCKVNVRYVYDADINKPKGKGAVIDCENYSCSVNGILVTCEELKAALPKFGC